MSIQIMNEPQPVVAAGIAATAGWSIAGFVSGAIPYLQFFSLLAGIVLAILTSVYTYKRIRAKKYD